MPFLVASVLRANEVFSDLDTFDPSALRGAFDGAARVSDVARSLGLLSVLETEADGDALVAFLDSMPRSLDAAVLAAVSSALERDLRVQLSWQPGYDFEVRMWEVSRGAVGLANIHIVSPHPDEPARP